MTASPDVDGPTPGRNTGREPLTREGGGGGGLTSSPGCPPQHAQAPQTLSIPLPPPIPEATKAAGTRAATRPDGRAPMTGGTRTRAALVTC